MRHLKSEIGDFSQQPIFISSKSQKISFLQAFMAKKLSVFNLF